MQHHAWLQTVTDYGKKKDDNDKNGKSNFELFKESVLVDYPDMGCYGYLFNILKRTGGCKPGFNGASPITVMDIAGWCSAIGVELFPTEIEILASLSSIYCSGLNRYRDPENKPPRAIGDDGNPNYGYIGLMQQEMRNKR